MKRNERRRRVLAKEAGRTGERREQGREGDDKSRDTVEEKQKRVEGKDGVKCVTHSCPHHQRPVLIYPEQSIRSGGRH